MMPYQSPNSTWTQLTKRRLQNLGGTPQQGGMVPQPLPPYATAAIDLLVQAGKIIQAPTSSMDDRMIVIICPWQVSSPSPPIISF